MDLTKQKRQIEILAMCLPDKRDRIDVADLSMLFSVGEATINRDLQDLRKRNIPINSVAKRGIVITDKIEGSVLKKELLGYIGHFYSEHLTEAIGGNAGYSDYIKMLEIFVTLNMAVESRKIVKIIFKGTNYAQAVEPLMITRICGEWELILKDKGEYLHRRINEIDSVFATDGEYTVSGGKELDKYIKMISAGKVSKHTIKLLLATKLNGKFPGHIIHTVLSKTDKDGKIIVDGECSSLEELANWVIANSDIAEVLEPEPLIDIVVKKAKEILSSHQKFKHEFSDSENFAVVREPAGLNYSNSVSDELLADERTDFRTGGKLKGLFQMPEKSELPKIRYYTPSLKDFWEYPYAIEF